MMALDITERKNAELRQAASEKRLKLLTDNLPVLIAYLDRERKFPFLNATFQHRFGPDPQTLIGRHLADGIGGEQYRTAEAHLDLAYRGQVATCEHRARIGDSPHTLETTFLPELSADGEVLGILRVRRNRKPLALAYLDIDYFKEINDTLGHSAGDQVLKEFATRLIASVRASNTVARLAGDEFVIIFEQVANAEEAARLACKIVDAMHAPIALDGAPRHVSTSIGLTLHEGDDETLAALVARADSALYTAKGNGRDGYAIAA